MGTYKKILRFFSKDKSSFDLESDNNLEFEADKSGMIHVRKHSGETKFLPGYGTTNFGVSAFDPEKKVTLNKVLIGTTALFSGIVLATRVKFRTLSDYALLLRESTKR